MALYIKELAGKERPKTILEFLKLFLLIGEGINMRDCAKATYDNKNCIGKAHCGANKMRSFDDILELTKTYYPSITTKKLFHTLLTMYFKGTYQHFDYVTNAYVNETKEFYAKLDSCGTMRRIRLTYEVGEPRTYSHCVHEERYDSKYAWWELLDMLGIKSQAGLNAYIKKNKKLIN